MYIQLTNSNNKTWFSISSYRTDFLSEVGNPRGFISVNPGQTEELIDALYKLDAQPRKLPEPAIQCRLDWMNDEVEYSLHASVSVSIRA